MATRSRSEAPARRRLNPDDRRREVLDAAVRVLRRRGPDDCRVVDITTEAGTAKGNFYRYFPTWDDLLLAVRDHLVEEYGNEVRERMAALDPIDWPAVLDTEIGLFIDFQLGLGGLHDAVFHGPASRTRRIDDGKSAVSFLAGFITAGIADGAFAAVDVDSTATLLFHAIHGAANEIRAGADDDMMRAAVLRVVNQTLAPEPPSPTSGAKTP
jgi:AcrR family transcriptional regulator